MANEGNGCCFTRSPSSEFVANSVPKPLFTGVPYVVYAFSASKNFEKSLEELRWHLIKEQLVEANKVTIDQNDVKEAALQTARIQFAQYGLTNVPEEYLENYANEMLKDRNQMNAFVDRSVNTKLADALKKVVKLEHKSISFDDFAKFFEAENA